MRAHAACLGLLVLASCGTTAFRSNVALIEPDAKALPYTLQIESFQPPKGMRRYVDAPKLQVLAERLYPRHFTAEGTNARLLSITAEAKWTSTWEKRFFGVMTFGLIPVGYGDEWELKVWTRNRAGHVEKVGERRLEQSTCAASTVLGFLPLSIMDAGFELDDPAWQDWHMFSAFQTADQNWWTEEWVAMHIVSAALQAVLEDPQRFY